VRSQRRTGRVMTIGEIHLMYADGWGETRITQRAPGDNELAWS